MLVRLFFSSGAPEQLTDEHLKTNAVEPLACSVFIYLFIYLFVYLFICLSSQPSPVKHLKWRHI